MKIFYCLTNREIKILPALLILLWAVSASAQEGFIDNFSEAELAAEWEVWTWSKKPWSYHVPSYYSLTDNPGHLRYYLGAMNTGGNTPNLYQYWYYPSLHLSRKFTGTKWSLETKVTFYLPYSNSKDLFFEICFGDIFKATTRITISKWIDQASDLLPYHFQICQTELVHQESFNIKPDAELKSKELVTYYFRIIRLEQNFLIWWSQDGVNFELVKMLTAKQFIGDEVQAVHLYCVSWFSAAGGFAEYDYIRVQPLDENSFLPAEAVAPMVMENPKLFSQWFEMGYLLFPERWHDEIPRLIFDDSNKMVSPASSTKLQSQIVAAKISVDPLTQKTDSLQKELAHYERLARETSTISTQMLHDYFKTQFLSSRKWIYERLVDVCCKLDQLLPKENYKSLAYHYIERIKGFGFLNLIAESQAQMEQNFEPALLTQEKEIISSIAVNESALINNEIPPDSFQVLVNLQHELQIKLGEVKAKKNLTNLSFQNFGDRDILTVDAVKQQLLNRPMAILSYFYCQDSLYLFVITPDSFFFQAMGPVDKIESRLQFYLDLISQNVTVTDYARAGFKLFSDLLAPVWERVKHYSRILIIPDGLLFQLPFESLVIQNPGKSKPVRFLGEDYNIFYNTSTSLLAAVQARRAKWEKNWRFDLWAMANPELDFSFTKQGEKLEPLVFSQQEVQNIARLFERDRCQIFCSQDATEDKIKMSEISSSKIIHFAVHSYVDEYNQWSPMLLLAREPNSMEDGNLQLVEIFNLKINAELVVLSGCQTGRGRYFEAEGLYNLSRAFMYAGASSMVTSLWSVMDLSTGILMEKFYAALKAGYPKDEALRRAKMALRQQENGKFDHPYYWAPFILIGDFD